MQDHFQGMERYNQGLLPREKIAEFIAGRVANPTKEMVEAVFTKISCHLSNTSW